MVYLGGYISIADVAGRDPATLAPLYMGYTANPLPVKDSEMEITRYVGPYRGR